MAYLALLPRDIPEATLCRVGAIAVLWGAIDHYIDQLIWQLTGLDFDTGRDLTVTMRTSAKRSCLVALINRKGNATRAARTVISAALQAVIDVDEDRDLLMHALWFPNQKTGAPEASSFKKRGGAAGTWKAEKFGDTRLDAIIAQLCRAHHSLGTFAQSRHLWQRSSREIRDALSLSGPYIPT